jgi:hypothetical protein
VSLWSVLTFPERLPHPQHPSIFIPLISINLQIPLPATPFFSHLYKTLGGAVPPLSVFCGLPTGHYPLSTFFSSVCRLFGPVAKLNYFLFKRMRTLLAKSRGWHRSEWHRHSCLYSDERKLIGSAGSCSDQSPMFLTGFRFSLFERRLGPSDVQTFRRSDVPTIRLRKLSTFNCRLWTSFRLPTITPSGWREP